MPNAGNNQGTLIDRINYGAGWDGRNTKNQTLQTNKQVYQHYRNMLIELAAVSIDWHGLPPEIDERFLNMTLLTRGFALFFHDDEDYNAFFACTATQGGRVNMYDNPTHFQAYGAGGFRRDRDISNSVPIWLNYRRMPLIPAINLYARRLTQVHRAIDNNMLAQNYPIFFKTSQENLMTVKNLVAQYVAGTPAIIADSFMNPDDMGYLAPEVPYIADKLLVDFKKIMNEFLTFLGINNANTEKRERMVDDEVNANNGEIELMALSRLKNLRMACKKINAMFGLNVSCTFANDIYSHNWDYLHDVAALSEGSDTDGGDDHGDVHNRSR
jgi:hypothetical protein